MASRTRTRARGALTGALALALLTCPPPAHAQFADEPSEGPTAADKETARNLMDLGRTKYAEGDYEAALDAFRGADKIMGVTSTGLWMGKSLNALGRLVEARDKLLEVARIPPGDNESPVLREAREEAAALQLDVADRIPELELVIEGLVEPARPTITIGQSEVPLSTIHLPRKVDPGRHTIVATAPGHFDLKLEITVAERERQKVTLLFKTNGEPITPPEPDPVAGPDRGDEGMSGWVVTGIVAGSVGAAGLILGAVTGGLSLSKASSAKENCVDGLCPADPDKESDRDASVTLAHVSTTGFVIGGVGAAVAAVALVMELTGDDGGADAMADDAIRVTPLIGPGFVGVQGRF